MKKSKTKKSRKGSAKANGGSRSLERVVRPLTISMARRIRVLIDACATCQSDGKLEIYPGSKTFGGLPLKNLTSELNMLLHGHPVAPSEGCKEV